MTQNDKKLTASQEIYMSDDCTAETLLANQTCAKYVDFRYGHCFEHPKRMFKLIGKTKRRTIYAFLPVGPLVWNKILYAIKSFGKADTFIFAQNFV